MQFKWKTYTGNVFQGAFFVCKFQLSWYGGITFKDFASQLTVA